jgi:hypothetical protein
VLSAEGREREPLRDAPDTLELDPSPVPTHARPAASTRFVSPETATNAARTFRYQDSDVYAGKGAPARRADAHLHVYRLVNADSVEQLHDVPVPQNGRVELKLPADTPLFEQLTDASGRALMSAHGPAQVRGFNTGAPGLTARCKGCHLGHSAAGH